MPYPADTVQSRITTALGDVRLAASARGLVGLWFDGQRYQPLAALDGPAAWPQAPGHPVLVEAARQFTDYLAGRRVRFDLPLDLGSGTPFQQAVWQALCHIAPGATVSYAALSRQVGRPLAVRAVGAAVGRNPVSVIVPCHRVIGSGGALTGYAGGLERKAALLRLEGALASRTDALPLFSPAAKALA